jgi:hypothetical protein
MLELRVIGDLARDVGSRLSGHSRTAGALSLAGPDAIDFVVVPGVAY